VTRRAIQVSVREEPDVAVARQAVRAVATEAGLGVSAVEALATAVSEIARNIVVHSRGGDIAVRRVEERGRRGVEVVARDEAPGIADLERVMQDGYSTGKGLGLGLPGARRLVDEFRLESAVGRGTTVTLKKWAHGPNH
jgi:serine/threonine-protein kinase RsbT